jgi:hypothetical protein
MFSLLDADRQANVGKQGRQEKEGKSVHNNLILG